jgi:hypothetical protein
MNRFSLFAIATLLLATACTQNPLSFDHDMGPFEAGLVQHIEMTIEATVSVGSTPGYYVGSTEGIPAPIGRGTCYRTIRQGNSVAGLPGRWHNGKNFAGPGQHSNCFVPGEGEDFRIAFVLPASHTRARSASERLDFGPMVLLGEAAAEGRNDLPAIEERWLRYDNARQETNGLGQLRGFDQHGGVWTIDLTQVSDVSGNMITNPMRLVASNDSHGDHLVTLAW